MNIILFDCHSHTEFSADSEMKITEALKLLPKLGIGLCLTEHLDFDFPGEVLYEFNPELYFDSYKKLQRKNNLLLGIEVGMQKMTALRSAEFVKNQPFDMIIVSQHILEGYDIYYNEYYQNKSKKDAYHIYLQSIAKLLPLHSFGDVLGHVDYICRKAPYDDVQLNFNEFADDIDALWRAALENNIVPEINTRRFGDSAAVASLTPVYKRYHDLGGRYATIGSDAHTADSIGYKLTEAAQFLKNCGLTPAYFKQHELIPITKI